MSEPLADRKVIACNFTEGTSECSLGALAYVIDPGAGSGGERVQLLARSRSGRWIHKWENARRLGNFRLKTLPPEHPRYGEALAEGRAEVVEMLSGTGERLGAK